ncbi:hypothetical protein MSG28_005980 [Choristoneura fumiferana]|uniref:Uncharacterized protein n=1 Tax=Choristoneura fumiferana TaxID=7141 RepID=A0ACC0L116_CHOFU|nr:hypothetical protein MSG28_005980 [Choristoneura fumiferana]
MNSNKIANKTSFRAVLEVASNLVGSFFPQRHLPRVPERWWGDEHRERDTRIRPFRVEFSDEMITDLRARIHNRRNITHALRGAAHAYGTNADYLNHFLDFWANDYDFKKREDWLNRFPQPPNPHQKLVLPLLMLHGWPVTAFEFVHVIDNLLSEREDCDFYQMAIIMKNLMRRLGKPRFYIHAGDIGHLRPETLVKYVLGQLYPSAVEEPRYQNRMYPLADFARFYAENTGYLHLHASRPDNASWLIQNIILATRPRDLLVPNGNLPQHYHMSDLFDSFTVYWAAQCMATSIRSTPTRVPFAAIRFRHELIYQPDSFLRDKYPNLVQALTMDFGGHFAGYEEPAALADSIWTAVKKMEAFTTRKDITEGLLV